MSLTGKQVLVTGADGFIGSHLVQRLLQTGAHVRAMIHYRGDPRLHNLRFLPVSELDRVEVIRGAVEDPYFVRRAVEGCDVVFHLAALIAIPYSYLAPASYVQTNIQGTLNVLEACRSAGTRRLVHTSTSECYGTAQYTPIDEDHPLQGQSPYSASKISADKLAESYYRSFSLPVVTIRPFNTFGPRQSGRAVIPTIIGQLVTGVERMKLGALSPVRDFTFVTDTVEGFVCGAVAEDVEGEVINLGTGHSVTIGELAQTLMGLMSHAIPIDTEEGRLRPDKSEVMALISSNHKAQQMLKWAPVVSLEDGLGETIRFFEQHPELLQPHVYGI